eukprot:5223825-Alexandrium_andersonii.AAC.1
MLLSQFSKHRGTLHYYELTQQQANIAVEVIASAVEEDMPAWVPNPTAMREAVLVIVLPAALALPVVAGHLVRFGLPSPVARALPGDSARNNLETSWFRKSLNPALLQRFADTRLFHPAGVQAFGAGE